MLLVDHLLFALLGVGLPALLLVGGLRRRATPLRWTAGMKIRLYYSNGALLYGLAGLVVAAYWLTGRPLSTIGLGWGRVPYDLTAVVLLAGFLLLYMADLAREAGHDRARGATRAELARLGFLPVNGREFVHFIFLALAAGVGEEVVYRGFLITYLEGLLGAGPLATALTLVVPALIFGLAHLYQGWRAVGKIVAMAVLFGFFYFRTRTLWPLMLVHAAIDVLGGLVSWYLLGRRE